MVAPTTATPFTRGEAARRSTGARSSWSYSCALRPKGPPPSTSGPRGLLERSQKEIGFSLRVSAGAVGSGSGKSAGEILAADGAMYEAKRRGKDGIFVSE